MQSTLIPNDPHDVLEIAPDVVLVARAEQELSRLARGAARRASDSLSHIGPAAKAGPTVPPVDATFRATTVDNVGVRRGRPSIGERAIRSLIGFLLAVCIGIAAAAWQAYGDTAKQVIAGWTPQFAQTSSPPDIQATPEPPNPPAAQTSAATLAPPAPAAPAGDAAASSADQARLLQSMARDLATVGQEVEQLKASIAELKASQQQVSRDVAKVSDKGSEPSPRPRMSAVSAPPHAVAAPARRPISSFRPSQAAVAPASPPPLAPSQAAAPYLPPPPQAAAPLPLDPELTSVPRPPMPVRQF